MHKGTASTLQSDPLTIHAREAYGHCLNQDKYRNREVTAVEFAKAISECYDITEPHTAEVVKHLLSLPS